MIDLRRRRVVLGMTAGVAAALGVSGILLATTVGADPSREPAEFARKGTLRLVPGQTLVSPFPRLDRGRFRGAPGDGARLAEGEQVASIFGSLVPVAVRSSEGSIVAFSSLRVLVELGPDEPGRSVAQGEPVGIPSVRVLETGSRRVRLLERGAHSPALSLQGRLAFFKGDADVLRGGVPYEGHVLVGDATGTRFERWTTEPARYMPYAWAGGTLLVYRALPGSEATDLYAYTGPGEARLVAPLAFVIALSPDGTRVLVSSGRRMVQIVRIDDGAIEASLALDGDGIAAPDSDTTPHMLEFSGSWRGKHWSRTPTPAWWCSTCRTAFASPRCSRRPRLRTGSRSRASSTTGTSSAGPIWRRASAHRHRKSSPTGITRSSAATWSPRRARPARHTRSAS